MAEGAIKTAGRPSGAKEDQPDRSLKRAAVLEEARARDRASEIFPIWVRVDGKENIEVAFRLLLSSLRSRGDCYQDVQSEPHPSLTLVDYFQVSTHVEGQREPENLGMVSLYSDARKGSFLIKISPDCPAYSELFIEALGEGIGRLIEKRGAQAGLDIRISQGPSFERE